MTLFSSSQTMAVLMKFRLVPFLEWTQVKGQSNRSDLVARYSKNEKEMENVYFERPGTKEWSPSVMFGTDASSRDATVQSCFENNKRNQDDCHDKNDGEELFQSKSDVIYINKQSFLKNSCQPDCGDVDRGKDVFRTGEIDCIIGHVSSESLYSARDCERGQCTVGGQSNFSCPGFETEPLLNFSTFSEDSKLQSDQEVICAKTRTVSDLLLAESIKHCDGSSLVISDKIDDRDVAFHEHSTNLTIDTGYLATLVQDTVTQTDNRTESVKNLQYNNLNSDVCCEIGGKSWFESCGGCKHKHPVVCAITASGEGREADGGCSRSDSTQVDSHPHAQDTNNRSSSNGPKPNDGNVKFVHTLKGVVKYTPSLTWEVQILDSAQCQPVLSIINSNGQTNSDDIDTEDDGLCETVTTDATDAVTLGSVLEQREKSCFDIRNNVANVNVSAAAIAGAMLPNSNTHNESARESNVCSAYDSGATVNYNKLTDEAEDDSAVGQNPSLACASGISKNKYTERADVKGAITDNNPDLKSPRRPCCLISPGGPALEHKSLSPEICALQTGHEPTSKTDVVDNTVKWEMYKAEGSHTSITFSSTSVNISSSENGNSPIYDQEPRIASKGVFFSFDDQLPSGVESEGMPHVGETVDSQNSCYGIRRPRAAALVSSSNTNTKLSIGKTESLLQLQELIGKAKLSRETTIPVQIHSEGSRDTSSPVSSDAPISASAGQIQSYAAVLRANIKVDHCNGAGRSSCPTSQTNVTTGRTTATNLPEKKKEEKNKSTRGLGDIMGNQNSSGLPGERSRTPVLGKRKGSTQGLFRAAGSSMTRSVPVTPAGTPASIRSEKIGFFRKFRRNKNRPRSDSMASINSISSCASTASQGYPGRCYEDSISRDSQSSLATNNGVVGDGPTMAGTAPPIRTTATQPSTCSVNVPAQPHTFKQQTTILQPISERPNETYPAHTHNLHSDLSPKKERHLAEKIPDHISDNSVAHRSLNPLKRQDGTTGSNLTLTDDGSEYLTASETDLTKAGTGKTSESIQGTNSQRVVSEKPMKRSDVCHRNSDGLTKLSVNSSVDGARSSTQIEPLHGKSAGSFLPDQVSYQGANTLPASTKPKKSSKKLLSSKAKLDKSKTYAAVLGTGLFIANLSDTVSKDSLALRTQSIPDASCASPKHEILPESVDDLGVNFPSQAAAPVSQVESSEVGHQQGNVNTSNANSLTRSFADVVNSSSSNKRVVQPPRGPFGSLTRKDSGSGVSDTISETDEMPLAPGLHGKLPIAIYKHGMKSGYKPVSEPIVQPQNITLPNQAAPSPNTVNYKNIRPRTFATVAGGHQGGGAKSQIGVKTVPGGSPATTPDGPGGMTCHSVPRSTLSSAGSAPALGVCGARLRAAKAHSVQQLNASKSPPVSPTKPPENSPFTGTYLSPPQQAKSMPQLAGKLTISKDDSGIAVSKVSSEESVKGIHSERSGLPRPSARNKTVTVPKLSSQITKSKIAITSTNDPKPKDTPPTREKDSKSRTNLVLRGPADEMSVIKDESLDIKESVNLEMSVSVAQECISESSGSLHRLNTRIQQNATAKSDKQISQKEKMTAVKNSPEGKTEMFSKVPVLAQKVSPPGQAISSKAEATVTSRGAEEKNLGSDTVQQNRVPDNDETTVNASSKLPIISSTCNKLQSVAKDTKSSQSASNQRQTKQLAVTSNDAAKETNTGTNNLQAKHNEGETINRGSKHNISSREVEITSGPASGDQIKTTISIENVGVPHVTRTESEPKSGDVLTRIHHGLVEKIPAEEKRKTSAISTVNDKCGKQQNESETALEEESKSSPFLGIEGATANIAQSQPSPRLKSDLIKDEKQESKESSGTSRELQSTQEVPFVRKDCELISRITETSKHEKLTIEQSGNLEQKYTSVRIEKVPTENVVFTAKFNRDSEHLASNDSSISDDQLKPTDAKRDDISKEMGLGESKYVEDGSRKVAASKLSHRQTSLKQTKYKTDGKIIGVSDKSRSNEKVGSIGPDNAAVKNSQLPANAERECETKVPTEHKQEQFKSPEPPPSEHRITNSSESQQHSRQQTIEVKSEDLSAPSRPVASAITAVKKDDDDDDGTNLRTGQLAVEVPRSNGAKGRNGSDKKTAKSTLADALAQNTALTVPDERNPAASVSVEFSRNTPRFISENNTATGGSSVLEGTQVKISTDSNGSKPMKVDDKNRVDSKEKSDLGAAGDASNQCKVDIDIKSDLPSQTSLVTQDAAINSKQENKQSEPGDKHAVNIVDGKDAQVCGSDSNQENQSITTDNDSCETITREADRTSGYKPKIFDEMISVKDVNVPSECSSAWGTSLEMKAIIQSDIQSLQNCATTVERAISQTGLAEKSTTLEGIEKQTEGNKEDKFVQKVKISIDQTDSLSVTKEVALCDQSTELKIITGEEVTFTIDIPAECARAGKPLPEVNEYVSSTCVAVTSTSGTINTTSQLGGNETCTSVSDDGQTLMSVSSGSDLPLASSSTSSGALSRHRKDNTLVNICIDRVPSAAEVVEGSAEVKHTGQQETGKFDPAASKADEAVAGVTRKDMNTEQVEAPPGYFASNEAIKVLNNEGQFSCERLGSQTTVKEAETSADNVKSSCTLPAINELGSMCELSAQHMEGISYNDNANAQFGRRNEHNTSLSCGKHSDKLSPNESLENSGTIERRVGATADPISTSKPTKSEQAHSTAIASREGSGCDPGNVQLAVEEIRVSSSVSCTASKNTTPQIAITTEIANKDPVVDCVPAESNVNSSENANITDYLKVDDQVGLKGAESDNSSIGRLIHRSEGEHSDVNFDDIVMRNMEECRIGVSKDTSESSESGSDSESDEMSSARESESEEDNNKVGSRRKGTHTVNDSDSSDDSCDNLKFKKIENVDETSSDDESSDSEEGETKTCITDDEDHIKDQEKLEPKSPEDCYASKLENMGHKVGEAYFVTRRRKRAKMVDRETITMSNQEVQCPEVCHVSTDTFDSILISSSGSSDTSPSRVQWEDDSVDELDAGQNAYYSDEEDGEWYYDDSDDSVYSDDEDSQLGATAAGPVKVIYSRPRPDSPRQPRRDGLRF